MARNRTLLTIWSLLACCVAIVVPAAAQHFKLVTGSLTQVAAGRTEVFDIAAASQAHRYNPGTKAFVLVAGSPQFFEVAVGGGTLSQKDEVWGVGLTNQIYHFNFGTKTFVQVPGPSLYQITIGEGDQDRCHPYEVWGLDLSGFIYRYNYCSKAFDAISGALSTIATAGGDVWGMYNGFSSSQIYHYDFGLPGWVQVQNPTTINRLTVGLNDVWGHDDLDDIWRYDPSSGNFVQAPGSLVWTFAGGDGVWGINSSAQVYRFDSSTESFVGLPDTFRDVVVGYGAGVWAIDFSNNVYTFVRP